MALDQSFLDAIKGFEGYSAAPAWDYKQSSSGYGTKAQPGDESIPPDQLKGVHEQRFQDEIGKAAASVDAFNPNLPSGVRAALSSLTYNAGPGWQQSGLGEAVRAGDYDKAREIFLQYNKAGGEVNPGLVARRQKEAAWFSGQPQPAQAAPAAPPQGLLAQSPGGLAPAPQAGGLLHTPIFPKPLRQPRRRPSRPPRLTRPTSPRSPPNRPCRPLPSNSPNGAPSTSPHCATPCSSALRISRKADL
jgi:lysozyme